MQSEQYQKIIKIVKKQQQYYSGKKADWEDSPFEWLVTGISSRQKGKVGEEIVKEFLKSYNFTVSNSQGTDSDMMVNGYKVEVKFSTLWENGIYKFQQIRDQDYDILFCLGISPNEVHAWVVRKSDIVWEDIENQHGGRRGGGNTWWIGFKPPNCPHEWMMPNNGELSKVCEELAKLTQK